MQKFIVIQEDLNESYGPFMHEDEAYYCARKINGFVVPLNQTQETLTEATETISKTEIKDLIKSEMDKFMNRSDVREAIRSMIDSEFIKMLKKGDVKEEIFDLTKDFTKKFYRELALNATYVIDRVR